MTGYITEHIVADSVRDSPTRFFDFKNGVDGCYLDESYWDFEQSFSASRDVISYAWYDPGSPGNWYPSLITITTDPFELNSTDDVNVTVTFTNPGSAPLTAYIDFKVAVSYTDGTSGYLAGSSITYARLMSGSTSVSYTWSSPKGKEIVSCGGYEHYFTPVSHTSYNTWGMITGENGYTVFTDAYPYNGLLCPLSDSRFIELKLYGLSWFNTTSNVWRFITGTVWDIVDDSLVFRGESLLALDTYGFIGYQSAADNAHAEVINTNSSRTTSYTGRQNFQPILGTGNHFLLADNKIPNDATNAIICNVRMWHVSEDGSQINFVDEVDVRSTYEIEEADSFNIYPMNDNNVLLHIMNDQNLTTGSDTQSSRLLVTTGGITDIDIVPPVSEGFTLSKINEEGNVITYLDIEGAIETDYTDSRVITVEIVNDSTLDITRTYIIDNESASWYSPYGSGNEITYVDGKASMDLIYLKNGYEILDEDWEYLEFDSELFTYGVPYTHGIYLEAWGSFYFSNNLLMTVYDDDSSYRLLGIYSPYNKKLFISDDMENWGHFWEIDHCGPLIQNADGTYYAFGRATIGADRRISVIKIRVPDDDSNGVVLRMNQRDDGAGTAQGGPRVAYTPNMGGGSNRITSWGAW